MLSSNWLSHLMRHTAEQQALELKLTEAQRERDRWRGKYQLAYEAAAKLVAALERRLQILKAKPEPEDRLSQWGHTRQGEG